MASMITITVLMEADDKVQTPERVGKQAGEAIAKLLHETYVKGAPDEENPLVRTRGIAYSVSEAVALPDNKKTEKKK